MNSIAWLSCLISVVAGSQSSTLSLMVKALVDKGKSLDATEMFPLNKTLQAADNFTADMKDYVGDVETIVAQVYEVLGPGAATLLQAQEEDGIMVAEGVDEITDQASTITAQNIDYQYLDDGNYYDDGSYYGDGNPMSEDYMDNYSDEGDGMSVEFEDDASLMSLHSFIPDVSEEVLTEAMIDLIVLDGELISMANKLFLPLSDLEAKRQADAEAMEHYTVINLYRTKILNLLTAIKLISKRIFPHLASRFEFKIPGMPQSASETKEASSA